MDSISMKCVSSEDIKADCNATKLVFLNESINTVFIERGNEVIGSIESKDKGYIEDVCISMILVYGDQKFSDELTKRYKDKILIFSKRDILT